MVQIEKALKRLDDSSGKDRERIRDILQRYVDGMISLDEAWYELLDAGLVPMPQRCGLSSRVPRSEEDEMALKAQIASRLR